MVSNSSLTAIVPHLSVLELENDECVASKYKEGTFSAAESDPKSMANQNERKSYWQIYGGLLMALSASVFFSCTFLMIKIMQNSGVEGFATALLLNLCVFIPSLVVIIFNEYGPGWKRRERVLSGLWPLKSKLIVFCMIIQGILQAVSVVLRSLSLGYLSVADMTVIVFSAPIVTTILAHFLVGEKCGWFFFLIAIFTLCGVGFVTKPPILTGAKEFDSLALTGSAFAAGAMLTLSMKFVVTRKIKETHFLAMTSSLGFFGIVVSLPLFLIFESPESIIPQDTTGLLLRLGMVSAFFAVASINLALKMEDAGVVSLVRSCDVIFAFALQYFFLGVIPDIYSGIGAAMVWAGVLVAGIRKYFDDRRKSNLGITEP